MIYFPFPDFDQTIASFNLKMKRSQLKWAETTLDDLAGIIYISKRTLKYPPKHVQAWRDHEKALARYALALHASMMPGAERHSPTRFAYRGIVDAAKRFEDEEDVMPDWWGNPIIHESHQKALAANDKKLIVWPLLPTYPQVKSDKEYEERKRAIGEIDPKTLDKANLRAYRLEENALMRYIWSDND